jgi:hypothetical protein
VKITIGALTLLAVLFAVGFFMRFYMSSVVSPPTAPIAASPAVPRQTVTETPSAAVPTQPAEDPLTVASKAAISAANECRAKRLSGELKTYVESVECSNPRIVEAWSAANYKYLDLVKSFAAKRLDWLEGLIEASSARTKTSARSQTSIVGFGPKNGGETATRRRTGLRALCGGALPFLRSAVRIHGLTVDGGREQPCPSS